MLTGRPRRLLPVMTTFCGIAVHGAMEIWLCAALTETTIVIACFCHCFLLPPVHCIGIHKEGENDSLGDGGGYFFLKKNPEKDKDIKK